jgi:hypothetical protein
MLRSAVTLVIAGTLLAVTSLATAGGGEGEGVVLRLDQEVQTEAAIDPAVRPGAPAVLELRLGARAEEPAAPVALQVVVPAGAVDGGGKRATLSFFGLPPERPAILTVLLPPELTGGLVGRSVPVSLRLVSATRARPAARGAVELKGAVVRPPA